jgi:HD-GYP domain-containing protein (c-di-GMP phosphodiesterase class II)
LKGEEILPGAMVLAVADTVESMASDRPYRPACGLEEALKEIERQAGKQLDMATAMACLRLFREKGFKMK